MSHLRLRAEHQPTIRPDGRIQIGSLPGLASTLPDLEGWRRRLLQLLDGTLTADQAAQTITTEHPDVPAAQVQLLLLDLLRAGHVQDAAPPGPAARLNADTVRLHRRGIEYWEMVDRNPRRTGADIQQALARSAVAVVGIGGVGSNAAAALAAAGVGRLILADHDRVEDSNLNRQVLYTRADLGRHKVDAARDRLLERHPDLDLVLLPEQITRQVQFTRLMRRCDLLILAADEPDGLRLTANRAALTTSRPWIDPGYHGPVISTALYTPGTGDGPCWECLRHFDATAYGLPGVHGDVLAAALPRPLGNPVISTSALLAGAYAAHAALAHLTGTRSTNPAGAIQRHSLIAPADQPLGPITHPRNPDCPSCAPYHPTAAQAD
ncbi:ThiF family adenylyltransferase [Kitasatospora sp. NBC_01300]|uniref:HesA/MoeB/ThiF family protein n=1 Tax=Kitasatospora sp. NBC_01300 TaxID=2903574 RepID=UPI00352F2142|nr:ThiF family adenylyltransferase [Kitasatospora sp. NBC_01300]